MRLYKHLILVIVFIACGSAILGQSDFKELWPSSQAGRTSTQYYSGYSQDQVGLFPVCNLPYPIIGGFPSHRIRNSGNWEQNDTWYGPVGSWYVWYPMGRHYYSRPRNYTSQKFVEEWRNQEPEVCGDDLDSAVCGTPLDFSESILLAEGMNQEEVTEVLGVPIQRIRLGEREIWKYSAYSLMFEFGSLREIR